MIDKKIICIIGIFIMLAVSVLALSLTPEEKQLVQDCRTTCILNKDEQIKNCIDIYNNCKIICKENSLTCIENNNAVFQDCKQNCLDAYEQTNESNNQTLFSSCLTACARNLTHSKRSCSQSSCINSCSTEKQECIQKQIKHSQECKSNCIYTAFNSNITCENGAYAAGTAFVQDCNTCKCNYNGEISCKKSPNCHFTNFTVSKESCTEANGLYQQVCIGPYFRLRCSVAKYCLCAGDNNYQCPESYMCLKDFYVKVPPSIPGWKNMVGLPLGDIGICAELPELENCGDGICQNVLCEECPKPETSLTCPEDCQS